MKLPFYFFLIIVLCSCKKNIFLKENQQLADSYYEKAKSYRDSKVSDSAYYYYNLAEDEYLLNKDSLGAAKSLVNMAILQTEKGDFYGSIETSLEANKLLKRKKDSIHRSILASNYNNMGISSSFLKDDENSIKFYTEALKYSNDEENKYVYYNNLGDALLTSEQYGQSISYLEKAILVRNRSHYARALNNLARAKFLENHSYDPLPELYMALEIRKNIDDSWGQNSSFATLSDYYSDRDKKTSLFFAKKMLEIASKIKSPNDELQAINRIINLESQNYLNYFNRFQLLNDSLQITRNKAKNQFALIRYDVEKLKTETVQKQNYILRQYIILGVLSVIIVILAILLSLYKKRQKILKHEKELEIKNTELKYSKKVHDVVANGLYYAMTEIENQDEIDKDKVLNKLEDIYEKSRDISYENFNAKDKESFNEKISKLLGTFQNESRKIFIVGNDRPIWEGLSTVKKEDLFQVIRELMINMKKHSHASQVVLRFERVQENINIFYSDNGIGIKDTLHPKNGIKNMENRTQSLNGKINFDTQTEKGLKITISFPIS